MKNTSKTSFLFLFLTFLLVNLPSYSQELNNLEGNWKPVENEVKLDKFVENANSIEKIDNDSDFNDDKTTSDEAQEIWDPFETVNRGIFWFNDKADTYLIGPISRGYDFIMPEFAQTGVRNFFSNLSYPVNLLSDIIRFDFGDAGIHTSRFLINTVLGIGGLFDVATAMGVDDISTDIGLALQDYDVPAGPYIVIPFIGPSNLRDGLSLGAGTYISPFSIAEYSGASASVMDKVKWGGAALNGIQTRADGEEALNSAKEASIDYYLFMQSAYYQFREGKLKKLRGEINDDNLPKEDDEDEWNF